MKIAVLIDNYNYARFLEGCLASVLAQSRPADEIIVVDDGSTDDSRAVLDRIVDANRSAPIRIVAKPNGGQLSAFNAGAAATQADVVCFLDSDDEFESAYLAEVERSFDGDSALDVLYTAYTRVFEDGRRVTTHWPDARMPPQRLETAFLLKYCGGPTSCIAVSRKALDRLLPARDEAAWRVSADDVLVMKSAASGMVRRTGSRPCIRYRIHGGNLFHGRKLPQVELLRRRARREVLLAEEIASLSGLPAAGLAALGAEEIESSPRDAVAIWRRACLVARLPVPWYHRPGLAIAWIRWLVLGPRR